MRIALLLFALSSVPVSADVLTVGPGAGDDYTTIQAAVDAALEDDLILVRSGLTQAPVTVDGKSVTIFKDPDHPFPYVFVKGPWVVRNLGPTQSFALFGLDVAGGGSSGAGIFRFNEGPMRFAGARIRGSSGVSSGDDGDPGVYVSQCDDVTFVDCEVWGGGGFSNDYDNCGLPGPGGSGLFVRESTVRLYGGVVRGGDGGYDDGVGLCSGAYGGVGGPALENRDGSVVAFGTPLMGGNGGCGDEGCAPNGPSAIFGTPSAALTLLGSSTPDGVPPTTVVLGATARRMEAIAPATSLEPTTVTVHGALGDVVVLRLAPFGSPPILQSQGQLLVGGRGGADIVLGTIGASGTLVARHAAPPLLGALGVRHTLQSVVLTPTLGTLAAGPVPWIVLDPSF